ncbi:hypothetical protein [Priestia aryabhattai]|uniref:hypothetical protein n=1 Tax=Priestia aryabhattai TaxID=412384 RepID=UPI003D2DF81E
MFNALEIYDFLLLIKTKFKAQLEPDVVTVKGFYVRLSFFVYMEVCNSKGILAMVLDLAQLRNVVISRILTVKYPRNQENVQYKKYLFSPYRQEKQPLCPYFLLLMRKEEIGDHKKEQSSAGCSVCPSVFIFLSYALLI